ncbi:tRNA/tmRNA/rRNA uracil-C5-methylase (TrmA/RlmC/RlmD family) [Arcanobacterium pluranimalium]|uniref:class I SAM-dependent RNA methyltransferase n=1 Tax=Arcanobacterium pluranimalium TaxID=108028 RepID=UPI0019565B65|nr:TRAM domain-containing protein [Arcanobacterium pluranimalium]MBM7825493.1 tRNA/tmRNA/rRNA uracil-C5-methylase (TrmA/RlmC/RlmD family) [Arcanobacterium pluranimalium]
MGNKYDERFTLRITDVAHGGLSVGRFEDRVVFVRGAIPGELVSVELTQARAKFLRGVVVDVIEPSEKRVEHPWPAGAAGISGAADFGHIDLAWQRELKTQVLRGQIRRIGGEPLAEHLANCDVRVRPIDDGDGWHWRTRLDLVKMSTGFGMYHERSHDLVPIDAMPLGVWDFDDLDLFGARWDSAIKTGDKVRVVSPSTGENVLCNGNAVFCAPGVRTAATVEQIVGDDATMHHYDVHANGFWQMHLRAPKVLLSSVLEALDVQESMKIVDLFAGAGLFSVPIAKRVGESGRVLAVEGSKTACVDAAGNLEGMDWAQVSNRRIDSAFISRCVADADCVIADPPRAGLGVESARVLANSPAQRIALISCDPASMARDAAAMVAAGRHVKSIEGFDIFPNTHHFEVVTIFE